MIKACIFDCDGTLLDTLVSIMYCANRALADFNLPQYGPKEYKQFVGEGARVLMERCLKNAGDETCRDFEAVFLRYCTYFKKDCMYEVKPYKGIVELLHTLKENGIRLAVLSNKPHEQTVKVIADSFDDGLFDYVLGQKEEIRRKPAPDGALLIAKEFGVTPQECLYIGDTGTDMQTGNAAGMHSIGVLWGFRDEKELRENRAELLAEHPREIAAMLTKFR